jgi:hypothetical protein
LVKDGRRVIERRSSKPDKPRDDFGTPTKSGFGLDFAALGNYVSRRPESGASEDLLFQGNPDEMITYIKMKEY